MLKIKDNVTKAKLKEFGFKRNSGGLYYIFVKNDKDKEYETELLLEPLYRNNKKELVLYVNNKNSFEELDIDIDLCVELDILYDLIKADLVEKVGSDSNE